jgi:hypothetical protein
MEPAKVKNAFCYGRCWGFKGSISQGLCLLTFECKEGLGQRKQLETKVIDYLGLDKIRHGQCRFIQLPSL